MCLRFAFQLSFNFQNILFFDMGAQSTTATVVGLSHSLTRYLSLSLLTGYSTMKEKEKSSKVVPGLVVKGLGFAFLSFKLLRLKFSTVLMPRSEDWIGISASATTC